MRTAAGTSHRVSAGNGLFSLLGFMGLYALLSIVFVLLMTRASSAAGRARRRHAADATA